MHKYYAMDKEGAQKLPYKPEWRDNPITDSGYWSWPDKLGGEYVMGKEDVPPWLKPGQLWERMGSTGRVDNSVVHGGMTWGGYWWSKIEDHRQTDTTEVDDG